MVLHPRPSVRLDLNPLSQSTTCRLNLSGLTFTPDGRLWVISDETRSVESLECIQTPPPAGRSKSLRPRQPYQYGNAQTIDLLTFFPDLATDHEIDLEGIDYRDPYLWLMGSHSSKRKHPTGEDPQTDLKRLKTIVVEPNRHFLARIPWVNGALHRSIEDPDRPGEYYTAARLKSKKKESVLLKILEADAHFGAFIEARLPSKDNGLDLEGLALIPGVQEEGDRLFLGLRGPVLRGYGAILDLTLVPKKTKRDELKLTGSYRKHFLNLQGLGVRDLAVWQDQLLILAGPTLALDGSIRVFQCPLAHFSVTEDTCSTTVPTCLGEIPHQPGSDRAEGITLWPPQPGPSTGEPVKPNIATDLDLPNASEISDPSDTPETSGPLTPLELLVLYDAPHPSRLISETGIWADRFQWEPSQED